MRPTVVGVVVEYIIAGGPYFEIHDGEWFYPIMDITILYVDIGNICISTKIMFITGLVPDILPKYIKIGGHLGFPVLRRTLTSDSSGDQPMLFRRLETC